MKRADAFPVAGACVSALLLAACAGAPRLTVGSAVPPVAEDPAALADRFPLAPGDNIRVQPLGRTDACSYSFIQIRDRERPHLHASHDLTVTLLRGTGRLHVADRTVDMRPGDVAFVERGTRHYFVNTGAGPAAAFAMFAPPYDGTDQVPAVETER